MPSEVAGREVWGGRQRWGFTPRPLSLRVLALPSWLTAPVPYYLPLPLGSGLSTQQKAGSGLLRSRPSIYESCSSGLSCQIPSRAYVSPVLRALASASRPEVHHHQPLPIESSSHADTLRTL